MTALIAQIQSLVQWIGGHLTKILGASGATVAYLNLSGIIPDKQLKIYVAVIGVLTIWRGWFSGNAYNRGVADTYAGSPDVQKKIVSALAFVPPIQNVTTPFLPETKAPK
jgi:hypothetical protein